MSRKLIRLVDEDLVEEVEEVEEEEEEEDLVEEEVDDEVDLLVDTGEIKNFVRWSFFDGFL
tara:strand:+ start:111 stop:293 length:183 start_codon:yes stop_codon:yes gene_type:complete